MRQNEPQSGRRRRLYSEAERARRDATRWTTVQGILAPLQFFAFAVSLALVLRYLSTGQGYDAATASILVKTGFLYAIMITGATTIARPQLRHPPLPCTFTSCDDRQTPFRWARTSSFGPASAFRSMAASLTAPPASIRRR